MGGEYCANQNVLSWIIELKNKPISQTVYELAIVFLWKFTSLFCDLNEFVMKDFDFELIRFLWNGC